MPACRSRKDKFSTASQLLLVVRLLAQLWKRTYLPSALITGEQELLFPELLPLTLTLTRRVIPVCKSRTKTSGEPSP